MDIFSKEYKKLNPGQKEAVDTLEGPVMVVAGPGTGKTQVLGLRVANLLRSMLRNKLRSKVKPEEILALTFSESAAVSMRKRLARFVGPLAYEVNIKTFHAFCNEVILDHPEEFAFSSELKQLDELALVKRIKGILRRGKFKQLRPFYNPFQFQAEIVMRLGDLKREGVSPTALEAAIGRLGQQLEADKKINPRTGKPTVVWQSRDRQRERLEDLLTIYREYLRLNKKKGNYDFNDMVVWVTEKLATEEELREEYGGRFKYILSDEFQDTNEPQNRVIEILGKAGAAQSEQGPNVFVVGDDDQAIYRFQGASLKNVLAFEKSYPGAKIIPIEVNYRSGEAIVGAADSLIGKNQERLSNRSDRLGEKKMKASGAREKGRVIRAQFSLGEVEDYYVLEKVKELQKQGVALAEIAVICRTNREVSEWAEYLMKAGISVEIAGAGSVLEKEETRELVKLLRLVDNPRDNALAWEVMSWERWEIDPLVFYEFTRAARGAGTDYARSFANYAKDGDEKTAKIRQFFERLLAWHRDSANKPAALLVEQVLDESGIMDEALENKDLRKLNRLASLFGFIRERNRQQPDWKLSEALRDLAVMEEDKIAVRERELSMAADDVRIMTAHAAKGREFEAVFIPRLFRGNWDGRRVNEIIKLPWEELAADDKDAKVKAAESKEAADAKEEEERRLFYVAMTRAKGQLFLTSADKYEMFGDTREKAPSKFLEEIDEKLVEEEDAAKWEDAALARIKQELAPGRKSLAQARKARQARQEQEEAFLRGRIEKLTLSPTSLNLYLSCPKQYKYEKLLLVPKMRTKQLSLGTAAHKALEDFFADFRKRAGGQRDAAQEKALLLEAFGTALDQEVMAKDERKAALEEGQKILTAYYDEYWEEWKKPLALETKFGKVFMDGVRLTGTVDKIEPLGAVKDKGAAGGNSAVVPAEKATARAAKIPVKVVDYKTGRAQTRNEILGKTKNATGDIYRQLVFYKMLSKMDKNFPYEVQQAEVDFIKSQNGKFRREFFEISDEEVKKLEKLIGDVIKKIKNLEFGEGEDKRKCAQCELVELCGNN